MIHRLFYFSILFSFFVYTQSFAEYRAYRLGVKYDEKTAEQEILTTLDDMQYVTYFNLTPNQKVRLIDHWMCWGRTDYLKAPCSRPSSTSLRAPANTTPKTPTQNPDQSPAQVTKPTTLP
jgi:hypothetical protein